MFGAKEICVETMQRNVSACLAHEPASEEESMSSPVEALIAGVRRARGVFSMDLETTGLDPKSCRILSANFAWADKSCGLKFVGKDALPFQETMDALRTILEDPEALMVGHNCLTGDHEVLLADGTKKTLATMVREKNPGPVLTLNEMTGRHEPRRVVGWICNPQRPWEDWVRIRVRGKGVLRLTKDHEVLTSRGRIRADAVVVGDRVFSHMPELSPSQRSLVLGSLLGDGWLSLRVGGNARSPHFTVAHGQDQHAYADLKAIALGDMLKKVRVETRFGGFSRPDGTVLKVVRSRSDARLLPLWDMCVIGGRLTITEEWLTSLDDAALAIWFCDDGYCPQRGKQARICVSNFGRAGAEKLVSCLSDRGWPAWLWTRRDGHLYIIVGKKDVPADAWWDSISPYVPLCMAEKLPVRWRQYASDAFWLANARGLPAWADEVIEVGPLARAADDHRRYGGYTRRWVHGPRQFCLVVDGNRNFFASGLAVSNCKYDISCLSVAGYPVKCRIADTMILVYLLDESLAGTSGLSLQSQALMELGVQLKSFEEYAGAADLDLGQEGIEEKGVQDAVATLALWNKLEPRLKKDAKLWKCFWDLEMPIVHVLVEMELTGVVVDVPWMWELKKRLESETREIEKKVRAIAGRPLNVGSTEQVSRLLFGDLKLEPKPFMLRRPRQYQLAKSVGTDVVLWSTKEEVLSEYASECEAADLVLDYRHKTKLVSTNLLPFIEQATAHPEGRIFATFWQTGTESGRWSSSNPNMQNLPRDEGMIRRGIVAPPGCVLVYADLSQVELRLMADRSRDPKLLEAYFEGRDIHQMTMDALGIKERTPAKNVNFGVIFDIHAPRLQKELWVKARVRASLSDCARWILRFFETYPGVKRYHIEIAKQVRENGFVRTLVGRYRRVKRLLEEEARGRGVPGYAFRVALNATIQGSNADLTAIATRNLYREIVARRAKSSVWERVRPVVQVHDSLMLEAPETVGEEALALLKFSMENAVKLPSGVPIVANGGIGHSWEDAELDAKRREKAEAKKVP